MKILHLPFAISFLLISCSVKKQPEIKNKITIRYPKVNEKSELFDLSKFGVHKNETLIKNGDTIYLNHDIQSYSEYNSKRRELKDFNKSKGKFGKIYGYDYSSDSIFGVFKQYYINGTLEEKGIYCWFGFKIGNWFYFDKKGKLVKTIDYDTGYYNFNTDSLFSFCKENSVPFKTALGGRFTTIHKSTLSDGTIVWRLNYPRFDLRENFNLTINAANGKVISLKHDAFNVTVD